MSSGRNNANADVKEPALAASTKQLDKLIPPAARATLKKSGTKADLDMDNGHAGGTRVAENACGTSEEGVFIVFGVNGNAAGAAHAAGGFLPDSILIQARQLAINPHYTHNPAGSCPGRLRSRSW